MGHGAIRYLGAAVRPCSLHPAVLNPLMQGEFTMLELANLVKEVVNPNAVIEFRENTADDPKCRKPDITKIKTTLGWEPVVPLREGLERMVDDFKKRLGVE